MKFMDHENIDWCCFDALSTNEILQEIIIDTVYNFENTGIEEQRVYGLSYSGELSPVIGEHRENTTASGCFIHSGSNLFIRINKTATCLVAVSEEDLAAQIAIFPNPASNQINIIFQKENSTSNETFRLINLQGKVIDQIKVPFGKSTHEISLKNYASGIYFLQYLNNNEIAQVKKVIVEK